MTFSTVSGLPVVDLEHVPEHIRIDRLTTQSAVSKIYKRRRTVPTVLYQLWEGDTCIMIGSADDIASELGTYRSMVSQHVHREALFDKRYRIKKA